MLQWEQGLPVNTQNSTDNQIVTISDPVTKTELIRALQKVSVTKNQIIEVHSSLSAFSYVIGGARTVVDALMEAVGEEGTILMPFQSSGNTEPSDWCNPAIVPELYSEIRSSIPSYHPLTSDIHGMGAIVENFVHRPGVQFSGHPNVSYAAWGRYARLLCNRQSTHFPLAEESPTARLYELKGKVLLLGTDFSKVTCMHLAEYRCDARPIQICGACVEGENGPEWKKYLDLEIDSDDFVKIRPVMIRKNMIRETMLSGCHIQFFSANDAVDIATRYFEKSGIYDLYR